MPKFRYHRGGLQESMETVIEVSSKQDLIDKLEPDIFGYKPSNEALSILPYNNDNSGIPFYDERIGWHIYIVKAIYPDDSTWVIGFTDGPLE